VWEDLFDPGEVDLPPRGGPATISPPRGGPATISHAAEQVPRRPPARARGVRGAGRGGGWRAPGPLGLGGRRASRRGRRCRGRPGRSAARARS